MKRILLLLTILLAAIPLKSHAVLNTVNIDTVWSFDIKSCTDYDKGGSVVFLNDSLATIHLYKNGYSSTKYAMGIFNYKNKTISLKHFWHDEKKWVFRYLNKSRSKMLLTYDSTFYILNSLTLAIEDSFKFNRQIWNLFPTNSDSIVYLDKGGSQLYVTKDTITKFNYITKVVEPFAIGNGHGIYCVSIHPDCNKALINLSEPHGNYHTDTVMWLNFNSKETEHTIYDGNRLLWAGDTYISPDGMYWHIQHLLFDDEGNTVERATKFYNMSDSLVYTDSFFNNFIFSKSSSFIIMQNHMNVVKLLSLTGFSTMYLDSNWNRGDISDICQGDSLFWSSTGSKIYLNRIGVIPTSIIESKNGTRLYPNPTGSEVTIEPCDINFAVEKIKIFDSNGNQIDEYDNKNGSEAIKIDLRRYSNGMYMILLHSKDKSKSYKVIKE